MTVSPDWAWRRISWPQRVSPWSVLFDLALRGRSGGHHGWQAAASARSVPVFRRVAAQYVRMFS